MSIKHILLCLIGCLGFAPAFSNAQTLSVLDLAAARNAFVSCTEIIRANELSRSLECTESSMHNWLKSNGAFELLKESFQMCDVTRQRVTEVLDHDKDNSEVRFTDQVFIYVDSSVFGCRKHFIMKKEASKWVLVDPIEHRE